MKKEKIEIEFSVYSSSDELQENDKILLEKARAATAMAYAPYSNFKVAAVAILSNGEMVEGTNQENASTPAGLCAERVMLASASMLHPNTIIETIAISYNNLNGSSNEPATPCGICRQSLQEYEDRLQHPIRLILGGQEGAVYVFEKSTSLLPLAFNGKDLIRS